MTNLSPDPLVNGEPRRPDLVALAQGRAPVYLATKLFEYAGRLLSATAEEALVRGLRRGLAEQGFRSGGGLAFLPFRDSNEAVDPTAGAGLVTEQIYRLDVAAIRRGYAVVALLNDPQKDSGVCFEVGYAAALGRPIMPVVNDFIDYRFDPWGWVYPLDPILCAIAPAVLKEATIAPLGPGDRRRLYRRAQDMGITTLRERLADAASELVRDPGQFTQPLPAPDAPPGRRPRVHLEFGGGQYEWQRLLVEGAARTLREADLPCEITVAERYADPHRALDEAVRLDIARTVGAALVVTLGDGADMDAGSAALQGVARGLDRRVLLYYSGAVRWVTGSRGAEERNLMLQHSADGIVHALAELPEAVRRLLPA